MGDRIRSETDGPTALLTVLVRNGGQLPVGAWTDKRGHQRRVRAGTAAALVRRGHAEFFPGSDGRRWIKVTAEGARLREHLNEPPP